MVSEAPLGPRRLGGAVALGLAGGLGAPGAGRQGGSAKGRQCPPKHWDCSCLQTSKECHCSTL